MKDSFSSLIIITVFILQNHSCLASNAQKPDSLLEKNIVIVLDNSGSMKKNDPDILTKTVVKNVINRADAKTKIALLIFDKETRLLVPLTLMNNNVTKSAAEKSLDAVNYSGLHTNIPIAVERALYELKINSEQNSIRSIILLTDGYIDTGNKGEDAEKQNWLKNDLTQEALKEKIKIFGIAFTEKADFQLMQLLAQKTGGDYYRALSPEDIEPVFNTIYDKISNIKPETEDIQIKEEHPAAEKTNYLLILGIVIIVIIGIVAIVKILKSKTSPPQVIIKNPETGNIVDEGSVPPAKLIKSENGKEHIIDKSTFSVGRKQENDLCIPANTVSGIHAYIKFRNNKFFICDNHSSNSTYLNGNKVDAGTDMLLKNNDEIKFDLFKYKFLLPVQEDDGNTMLRNPGSPEENGTVLRKKEDQAEQKAGKEDNEAVVSKKTGKPAGIPDTDEEETELKQLFCPNHPAYKASELCPVCRKAFCKICMVKKDDKTICRTCAEK